MNPLRARRSLRAVIALVAMTAPLLGLGGCGFGLGRSISKSVQIKVTTNFGSHELSAHQIKKIPAAWTVMDLTRHFDAITTSDGGGYVDSIDGHHDASSAKRDWFYYVNGIEAAKGAAVTPLSVGDHIWWDLHDWQAAQNVPAVVGSYPEPFTSGSGGQAFPTVLTCASGVNRACTTVTHALSGIGVKVAFQGLGTGSGSDSLAVLVGTFNQLQGVLASELLSAGPSSSGVYARFVGHRGQALELENPAGEVTRTFHSTVGLIAAIEQPGLNEPVWLITGTNRAGVTAAARAFTAAKLANHFAVAVLANGQVLGLPLDPAS